MSRSKSHSLLVLLLSFCFGAVEAQDPLQTDTDSLTCPFDSISAQKYIEGHTVCEQIELVKACVGSGSIKDEPCEVILRNISRALHKSITQLTHNHHGAAIPEQVRRRYLMDELDELKMQYCP